MPAQRIRILGVDTSLRSTGIGVIEGEGNKLTCIGSATLKMPRSFRLSQCVSGIFEAITAEIDRSAPIEVAVESAFFAKNASTTTILGQARGAVIAACSLKNLPIFEYAPRRVKQAIACHGSAGKDQVARMVSRFLAIDSDLSDDETDALAIAICHFNNRSSYGMLTQKQI